MVTFSGRSAKSVRPGELGVNSVVVNYFVHYCYTDLVVLSLTRNCLHRYELAWDESFSGDKGSSNGWTIYYL